MSDIGDAKRVRASIAQVWLHNAEAMADQVSQDPGGDHKVRAAQAELTAAKAAASMHLVLYGSGMPAADELDPL